MKRHLQLLLYVMPAGFLLWPRLGRGKTLLARADMGQNPQRIEQLLPLTKEEAVALLVEQGLATPPLAQPEWMGPETIQLMRDHAVKMQAARKSKNNDELRKLQREKRQLSKNLPTINSRVMSSLPWPTNPVACTRKCNCSGTIISPPNCAKRN